MHPLVVAPGVQDLHQAAGPAPEPSPPKSVTEVGPEPVHRPRASDAVSEVGGAAEPVDADAGELAPGLSVLLGGVTEQGEGENPGEEPTEVGGEVGRTARWPSVPAEVAGGERGRSRRSTIHSPASMRRRSSAASAGCGGARSTAWGRRRLIGAHVGVVDGVGASPARSASTKSSRPGQCGVHRACSPDGGRVALVWVAAQKLPNPWVGRPGRRRAVRRPAGAPRRTGPG